jgi:YesN/AraC family two-component response regulator
MLQNSHTDSEEIDMMEKNSLLLNLKVLYVEDEDETRSEMSRFLKKRVGKLSSAGNGAEALDILEKESFDVLITDLQMPEIDGLSLVRKIRDMKNCMPVIITSAFSDSDTILNAVDLGIVKYCVKPIKTEELISNLGKVAADLVENRGDMLIDGMKVMDKVEKSEFERQISSEVAYFIKTNTGKGPKAVQTFISYGNVEVRVLDAYTQYECTLLKKGSNASMVGFMRQLFYTESKGELEAIIEKVLSMEAAAIEIKSDSEGLIDYIFFKTMS